MAADGQAARPTSHNASRSSSRNGSSSRVGEGAAADGQAARPTSNNASRSNSCSSASSSVGEGAVADGQVVRPTSIDASRRNSTTPNIKERRSRHNRRADNKKYRIAAEGRVGKTGDASTSCTQVSAVNGCEYVI